MQLRYVIIPLLILLYLYWSFQSIKDIKSFEHKDWDKSTGVWIFCNIIAFIGWFMVDGIDLIIKYW